MLECSNLSLSYGQHRALDQVSLKVDKAEIVVILGANGAGKTSLLNAIAGRIAKAESSQVLLHGASITGLPANLIVDAGLALVPEGRGIFGDLSVEENLLLGAFAQRARRSEQQNLSRVFGLFPKLAERRKQRVSTMSGGEQQMVAIGRALMSEPEFLMLDEPSLGLSPLLCSELFQSLGSIRETGVGVLLVEQNARQALAISDRGYLLENGHIIGQGLASDLLNDESVKAAYLGGAASDISAFERLETAVTSTPSLDISSRVSPASQTSEDLLGGLRIADLVSSASEKSRQALSQSPLCTNHGLYPATEFLKSVAEPSIESVLSGIASAAQKACLGDSIGVDKELPVIEVYRRPKIEIYKRDKISRQMQKVT
ncbi:MAG: ABC transporter ATP-binding protein [Gammaproteobacteria bacterium]|nr:ABC transporter ATP-binding protein [Gammaproteobacteria bacterium]